MNKIRLQVLGLSSGTSSGSYTLILGESGGNRRLPIVIGSFEAQAIAIEIEKIIPFRPMTHDLFVNFCKQFGIHILEVMIYNLQEGVFHARLVCEQNGITREIDARTSDSIALAVRFRCPIFTNEEIMDQASIEVNDESQAEEEQRGMYNDDEEADQEPTPSSSPSKSRSLHDASSAELEQMLQDAIRDEDYALAAKIRDELNHRKSK